MTNGTPASPGKDPDLVLDGHSLRPRDLIRIVCGAVPRVDPASLEQVAARMHAGDRAAAKGPVYGRTTGVGANKDQAASDGTGHGLNLLRSHAAGLGEVLPQELVRAGVAVRVNQLLLGRSGCSTDLVSALVDLLSGPDDELPVVHRHGALGTGDLTALAEVALTLLGERPRHGGRRHATLALRSADALPLLSSNAFTLAEAALGTVALFDLAQAALTVSALSWLACGGGTEALGTVVGEVTPFPGAVAVAVSVHQLLGADARPPRRIQDFFGLRTWPQTHGPLLDSLRALSSTVESLLNAPCANPLYLLEEPPEAGATVAHHGGFHLAYLTLAVDTALLALTRSAHAVQSRISHLLTDSAAPRFLADDVAGSSGLLIAEYLGASSLAQIRSLAGSPTSVQSASVSDGIEDDASFANLAAARLPGAADAYRRMLAVELVCAVRSLRMQDIALRGPLAGVLAMCGRLPGGLADRDLAPDLDVALELLDHLAPPHAAS